MDLISVIVPIYNSDKYLEKCVKSILEQSYKNLEILLLNDGSKDSSWEICKYWATIDKRIKAVNKNNSGVSDTRNLGLKSANGKYVMFVDSDDYLEKDACENLYNALILSQTETAIGGYYFDFYSNGNLVKQYSILPNINHVNDQVEFGKIYGKLVDNKIMLSLWGKLYSIENIRMNNIKFNNNIYIGEDLLFNNTYFQYYYKFGVSNHSNYHYTVSNPYSLTKTIDNNRKENAEFLFRSSIEFITKMSIYEYCIINICKYYFKSCMINIENAIEMHHKGTKDSINSYIMSIISTEETNYALKISGGADIEYFIYRSILLTRNVFIVKIFVKIRLLFKRLVRKV